MYGESGDDKDSTIKSEMRWQWRRFISTRLAEWNRKFIR